MGPSLSAAGSQQGLLEPTASPPGSAHPIFFPSVALWAQSGAA